MTIQKTNKPHYPNFQSAKNKDAIIGGVGQALGHDSALAQVLGNAPYIDDMAEWPNTLFVVPAGAKIANGQVKSMDLSSVLTAAGVVAVLTYEDIHGLNDVSPTHSDDDPVLSAGKVRFHGEPIFAVVAKSQRLARLALKYAKVEYEESPAILDINTADYANMMVGADYYFAKEDAQLGDAEQAMQTAPHLLKNSLTIGGQDQFYLEGQIAYAIPREFSGGFAANRNEISNCTPDFLIFSSTQHPSEVQHNVANVLNLPAHSVTVEVRRMGGGFGGKESQATQWAALAALAALKTGCPVKCRLDRDDDMIMTGKRHDFACEMACGFDDQGRILGAKSKLKARCGVSKDLSDAIVDRAMFHFDNAYYMPALHLSSRRLRTNTVSNTAFRGFGGPQGMLAGEWMLDAIARKLGIDPLKVRKTNFYNADEGRDETPFGMKVKDFILHELVAELEKTSDYWARRKEIIIHNQENRFIKRGLALTPVKFGISFTTSFLNQAGALVHIYKDGSVMLNHGGTEMGQGLFIKVAQVVADMFQIDVERVKITSTSTDKIPNTSATAASSGADMNGMAAFNAALAIKERLIDFAASHYKIPKAQIAFLPGRVRIGNDEISFERLVGEAYLARVQLSHAGFYKTPEITFDRASGKGNPFFYFAYGAAVSEVAIDCLTGETRALRTDILHDVGKSLNPMIDLGQIEGGYIQGMGWLTTEELVWDEKGRLRTHAPSTYKIPTIADRPRILNINLWEKGYNPAPTIHRSKAVGEPPLMLGIANFMAIADAISALKQYKIQPKLSAPATAENILMAIKHLKNS